MAEPPTNDDLQAWQWLTKIFNHWSNVTYEGRTEFRSPKNRFQIWYSRYYLRKINALHIQDEGVKNRLAETEEVVDEVSSTLPNYTKKILISIALFFLGVAPLLYVQFYNSNKIPEYTYDQAWFTMAKNGYMYALIYAANQRVEEVQEKIYLKKGVQIVPLGKMGTEWLQARTADGQIGFINYKDLVGGIYLKAMEDAEVFKKIGDRETKTLAEGTPVKVLDRKVIKQGSLDYEYVKLDIGKDSVAWGLIYDFDVLLFDQMPYINQQFRVRTKLQGVQENILGKSIDSIRAIYGPPTSFFMNSKKRQAYYKHLLVIDGRLHFYGMNILLNKDGIATDTSFFYPGKKDFLIAFH
jgi:hypothetical protein